MTRDFKHNWLGVLADTAHNGVFKEARRLGIRPYSEILSQNGEENLVNPRSQHSKHLALVKKFDSKKIHILYNSNEVQYLIGKKSKLGFPRFAMVVCRFLHTTIPIVQASLNLTFVTILVNDHLHLFSSDFR